jgi:hypothetical protein
MLGIVASYGDEAMVVITFIRQRTTVSSPKNILALRDTFSRPEKYSK